MTLTDAIVDACREARRHRLSTADGHHCSLCCHPLTGEHEDVCGGRCSCGLPLWNDDERDREYCDDCLEERGCVSCAAMPPAGERWGRAGDEPLCDRCRVLEAT